MFNITSALTYDTKEENLIKKLYKNNLKIYFLLNHSNPTSTSTKRMKQVYLEETEKNIIERRF